MQEKLENWLFTFWYTYYDLACILILKKIPLEKKCHKLQISWIRIRFRRFKIRENMWWTHYRIWKTKLMKFGCSKRIWLPLLQCWLALITITILSFCTNSTKWLQRKFGIFHNLGPRLGWEIETMFCLYTSSKLSRP